MSLASNVGLLATRVANYLRDSVTPRLIPAGGSTGQVLTKSSAADYASGWATPAAGGAPSSEDLFWFGDGSDGDYTATSGTTTLTRDTYYRNLTLSGSAVMDTAGYRLHALGVLDISGLTTGYIGRPTIAATDAVSLISAPAPLALGGQTVGSGPGGSPGTVGNTGNGAASTVSPAGAGAGAGGTGSGGVGGSGSAGIGGVVTNAPAVLLLRSRRPMAESVRLTTLLNGSSNFGSPGSGGGGDGTNRGSVGGASGQGGPVVFIFARTVIRGASTGVAAIRARGGKGGRGFAPTVGNVGGGGGGSGGGGGWVQIVYRFLTGATAANAIDVSGGDGADGMAGFGTGTAGKGGGAGWGGYASMFNLTTGTCTAYLGPQTNTNPTGQTGEVAAVAQASL